jgi:hypothetical protein
MFVHSEDEKYHQTGQLKVDHTSPHGLKIGVMPLHLGRNFVFAAL